MQLGYARVSKADDQDTAAQVSALKAAGCTSHGPRTRNAAEFSKPAVA
jgi:DNA invertase Pin-like site-specific DNA recombinase